MSLEPRPEVTAAATAMVVQASIGLTILTFAFGVEIAGIYQRWRKINFWRRRQDRIILWLMGLTIVTFSYYLDQLFMFAKDWTGDENGCIIAAPRIPHFFAIAKQFLYYFLFERSRVVHTSLMITSRRFIYFREFIGLIIIFGLAGAFYWTSFLTFTGRVLQPEGVCILVSLNIGVVISFAVCDFLFSFMLLALFAYPLYKHYRALRDLTARNLDRDHKLLHLLRKSLLLSTLISCSTVGSLVGMACIWIMYGSSGSRADEYLYIFALFIPSFDMVFSTCVGLLITSSWIPPSISWFTKYFFKYLEENTSPLKNSPSSPKNNQVHVLVPEHLDSKSVNIASLNTADVEVVPYSEAQSEFVTIVDEANVPEPRSEPVNVVEDEVKDVEATPQN